MRRFYRDTMGFAVQRELGDGWYEYRVGSCILALTRRGLLFDDASPPAGADGTVKLVTTSAPLAGIELIPRDVDGRVVLVLEDGQHPYIFERAAK
jgi:hypothetical protein